MLVSITEKGKQQALQAGELLKEDSFDAIFVSDMVRTQQTAKAIFGEDTEFTFDTRLREHIASLTPNTQYIYGKMPQDEWIKLRLEWFTDGESYSNQIERIRNFLIELSTKDYKKVAIVTHGGCMRSLYTIAWTHTIGESIIMERKDNCGVVRANLSPDWKLEILE